MPSLQELKQLKDLFGDIGHENDLLEAAGLTPSEYELPSKEPAPRRAPVEAAPPEDDEDVYGEEDADTPPARATAGEDDSGGPPASARKPAGGEAADIPPARATAGEDDSGSPPASARKPAGGEDADIPPARAPAGEDDPGGGQPAETAADDDDGVIDNLFEGLSDLITDVKPVDELPPPPDMDTPASGDESAGTDLTPQTEETAEDGAADDDDDLDLGQLLKNFDNEDAPPETAEEAFTAPDDLFNDDNTPDGAPINEPSSEPSNAPPAAGAPTPVVADDDVPSVSEISDEEKASLFPDVPPEDLPSEEAPAADSAGVPTAENDGDETPGVKNDDNGSQLGDLPELEDFLAPIDSVKTPAPAAETLDEKSKKTAEAISLTKQQLQQLLDTIASYPLNLRIVCEKIISEEIVEPALLSQFINLLVKGGNAREAAALAGKILKKKVPLPKGYKTGEELEAEQSSFIYIFLHKFFPIIRLSLVIAALAASVTYLSYEFIYKPVRAYLIYKNGYEHIENGDYVQGNRRFEDAFKIHSDKNWFYRYAELFRDEKQYLYAEEKYDELLFHYPLDKKGTLDYAAMETDYLRNYEKADRLIRANILDYKPDDSEGLLVLGDINLAWGEYEPSRYEEARLAYAKLLAAYGQTDPIMERMMLYFIRTDKLGEVIPLQNHFMSRPKSKISASSLAELGGYLLDKRFEPVKGVPDEHIESIENVRNVLIRAAKQDFSLPEVHYHLARYYNSYGATPEERQMLETAASAFDTARVESPKRVGYRVDTQRRLARLMIAGREFIPAEEALAKGVNIMEDAVERRVVQRSPKFGELYAYLGDLAYFAKSGDMREAVEFYLSAEENGWSPPEMQYRMGSAYYRLGEYAPAMNYFFNVSMETPYNRRLLNALGAASYMRSDYFAAEGYLKRLVSLLENERNRFPMLLPNERPEHREIAERIMVARNNLGVTYNALANNTGRSSYRAEALGEFTESARVWDALERDPQTLTRAGITDTSIPGVSLPYINIQNTLYPTQDGNGILFMQIDKDLSDGSWWEDLMRAEGLP
ncbi:MAG: tetratricopeptide repeat protein [Spirochaetaceae bacterium]|jgi:tetratricopeptide (TPR) repeat protein|nr:tetratricopeptide repeat protein [Spirochaetaceae bacterium]